MSLQKAYITLRKNRTFFDFFKAHQVRCMSATGPLNFFEEKLNIFTL